MGQSIWPFIGSLFKNKIQNQQQQSPGLEVTQLYQQEVLSSFPADPLSRQPYLLPQNAPGIHRKKKWWDNEASLYKCFKGNLSN